MSNRKRKRKRPMPAPAAPPEISKKQFLKNREPLEGAPFIASVKTSAGNILLPSTSRVYVSFGKGKYVRKPAGELKAGEMVPFLKEGIDLDLKTDVEPILLQSPRYRSTLSGLFSATEGGEPSTLFSHELLKGIRGDLQEQVGELMRQRKRMDESEAAATLLHGLLESRGISRSISHIQNKWLGGATVAPRQFSEVFAALGEEMPSTDFARLAVSSKFADDYRLHMTLRQSIMRNLSLIFSGNGSGESNGGRGSSRGSIDTRPELRMVVESFAEEIDSTYALVRVFGVTPAGSPSGKTKGDESELYRGLVTQRVEEFEKNLIDLAPLYLAIRVLDPIAFRVVDEYFYDHPEALLDYYAMSLPSELRMGALMGKVRPPSRHVLCAGAFCIIGRMFGFAGDDTDALKKKAYARGILQEPPSETASYGGDEAGKKRVAATIFTDIESGALDRKYGLKEGMVHKLIDTLLRAGDSCPRMLVYLSFLNSLGSNEPLVSDVRVHAQELRREIAKVGKKVASRYGSLPEGLLDSPDMFLKRLGGAGVNVDPLRDAYYSGRIGDRELLAEIPPFFTGALLEGESLFSPDWEGKTMDVLREAGLEDCSRLVPGLRDCKRTR